MRHLNRLVWLLFVVLISGCLNLVEDVRLGVRDLRTQAKVGVLANLEIEWDASAQPFRRALAYFAQENVDAVILIGTLTRTGHPRQMDVLQKAWRESFRGRELPTLLLVPDEPQTLTVKGFTFGASYKKKYGAWAGETQPILAFHSGMKPALTDDVCFLSPASRTICAGSMHGLFVPAIFENPPPTAHVAQGLLVTILGESIEVKRLDFTQKTPHEVAAPWIVPLDPATPVAASQTDLAPRFPKGAVLDVIPGYIPVKGSRLETERALTLRWPAALSRFGGSRAAYYELAVENHPFRKYFLSSHFYDAEDRDREPLRVTLPLAALGETDEVVRLTVTAYAASGKKGEIIYATPLRVR